MKPINFKYANKTLLPSGAHYSENVAGISNLPVWTDGEQCVSCWQMSLRERISALLFGRVWLAVLTGQTQPPALVVAVREYLSEAKHD